MPSSASVTLPAEDKKRLQKILEVGHRLEKSWQVAHTDAGFQLEELKSLIAACENEATSFDLQRLAIHARNLSQTMTSRHLAGILVPFERLMNRALRDDEFLVTENDAVNSPAEPGPFIVIADHIRSAFNVGAILRTAECFGAESVWLSGYTATPDDDKTARTSMGVEKNLAWESIPKASDAVARAKAQGYAVVALETVEGAEDLGMFQWPERAALLLGNERFGVDRELLAQADHVLRIPLFGQKNSLNVGIAFGIAIADWRRQYDDKQILHHQIQEPEASSENQAALKPLTPIGVFHSPAQHPYEARRQGAADESGKEGWVELEGGHQFEQALADLDGFERIWLLYRFHHNENWKPKVMPPRGPRVKRGVFATRSPYRPNPIGLSCVELVRIDGRKIYVRGFDLLDGSPIYDIKPYIAYADAFANARSGWLEGVESEKHSVLFTDHAEAQMKWLEANGVTQFRGFLLSQLEYAPLDEERKRVSVSQSAGVPHRIAYRTWRADFTLNEAAREIRVEALFTGYTPEDLLRPHDPYHEKLLHQTFLRAFSE